VTAPPFSWDVRTALEDWVNRRIYGRIWLKDGSIWVFFPASVTCRGASDGDVKWFAVGLRFDEDTHRESYAYAFLADITKVEELVTQPTPEE
jgi:hypothetical protein